jgi:L-ascorbate metabolism protein UlaG (beta-lactamase superfamily)
MKIRPKLLVVAAAFLLVPVLAVYALYGAPRRISGPKKFDPPPPDAIAFWGHACIYLDIGGTGIVTDPVFAGRYSPASRRIIGKPDAAACSNVKLILLSHAHTDHLNRESLALFPKDVKILCSAPCAKHLEGFDYRVLKLWEEYRTDNVAITAVPSDHAGGRYSLDAESDGRAIGFVISTPAATIYYSGDTRYFDGFREIGKRFKPDIAILNVNTHLRADAIKVAEDIGARAVIPAHHAAFVSPTSKRNYTWQKQLKAAIGARYREIPLGESVSIKELLGPGG